MGLINKCMSKQKHEQAQDIFVCRQGKYCIHHMHNGPHVDVEPSYLRAD